MVGNIASRTTGLSIRKSRSAVERASSCPRDTSGLGLEVVPRRGSVAAEALGIQGAEPFDDRALHRVVQSQPLGRGLHKGQPAQRVERVVCRVVAQHRGEHAPGDAPRDGGGIQHAARVLIEAGSERAGQRVDDLRHGVGFRHLATGEARLQRETQRQRVPSAHPRDLGRRRAVLEPGAAHDRLHAVVVESAQGEDFETSELTALDRPLEHGRLAPRDHDAHVGPERRQQLVTQPRISSRNTS